MKSIRCMLVLLVALASPTCFAIDTEAPLADERQEQIYQRLIHEVRCLVCQNQTIGDSTAPLAGDLRREIHRMVGEGRSEDDIKAFLLERYGDFVLYRPRFQVTTVLLWVAPLLLVAIGAVALARAIRRRAALPIDVDADENPAGGGGAPP
jgi:cytochrome c-type biogenesis protein CcmH